MDLTVRARLVSVAVADGTRFIGFAEGDADEPYALFAQGTRGGPVRFEVNDEVFGAEDAVARATLDAGALTVEIDPAAAPALGYASRVTIRLGAGVEGWPAALPALRRMLGARLVEAPAAT
jgi:hypothetical protein